MNPCIRPPRGSLGIAAVFVLWPACAFAQPESAAAPVHVLTLDAAMSRALASSPSLESARADAGAARGRLMQSGARSNPVLSFDAENLSASRGPELAFRGEQRFELGGKRGARIGVARSDLGAALQLAAAESLAVRAEVRRLYAEAQAAASATGIARQAVRNAEELSTAVARKVEAGAVSPAEAARASVEVANAKLEISEALAEELLSGTRLASMWGGPSADASALTPIPNQLTGALSLETLAGRTLLAPGLAALESRVEAAERNLALQRSLGVPDLDLGAGVRSDRETDEQSLVAGVSLPLPLFDRNAGNSAAAAAELARARAELARATRHRELELREGLGALERARGRRETLRLEVLPAARRAYEEILAGYLRGRFDYVDVLDARRSLISASRSELEAYVAHAAAIARLELALGGTTAFLDLKD